MFIVWGSKVVKRRLGFAADFCPICREVRAFRVDRVGKAGHLYGIALGAGSLLGHEKTCQTCGQVLAADLAVYKELVKSAPGADLEALVASTFPTVREHNAQRLALEDQVARRPGPLDAATRGALIREPFILVAPAVEARFGQTHVDLRATASLLFGLVAAIASSVRLGAAFPQTPNLPLTAFWLLFGAGVAGAVHFGLKARGRYMHKAVYPRLSAALRPLDPSPQEIEAALAELKRQGLKLGTKAKLDEVMGALKPANRLVA